MRFVVFSSKSVLTGSVNGAILVNTFSQIDIKGINMRVYNE